VNARPPRRPELRGGFGQTPDPDDVGPGRREEVAHATAAAVLRRGREPGAEPPLDLVERVGLTDLADLWRDSAPGTLPGALWTLYLLRTWCVADGAEAARLFALGSLEADVERVVAGVVEPPGPHDVLALADAVLTSTFRGDVAIAFERAAAFDRVIAAGRRSNAHDRAADDPDEATRQLRLAQGNLRGAAGLEAAARAFRDGTLR